MLHQKQKSRATGIARPFQNFACNSESEDNTAHLRRQSLASLGMSKTRADRVAALAWGGAVVTARESALALLNANHPQLTPKAGQFLGQLAVSPNPLTEKQAAWLATLLSRAGLPPLTDGGSA